MPEPRPITENTRKQRADAQRNRRRILEVAQLMFVQHGADVTMDDVARQAALGSGTLYRHFPTRDALIEAVYEDEVAKLTAAGHHLISTHPPLVALRTWMLLLIEHVASKKLILPVLETVSGGSMRLVEGTHGQIHATFLHLLQQAVDSGDLKIDLVPMDVVRALIGVFYTTALPGWEDSARRIVDILLDGVRRSDHPQD